MDSERRKNDAEIYLELREFMAGEKQWRAGTDEYRKCLDGKIADIDYKINDINRRIYQLPCESRVGLYESVEAKIKFIWGILILMIGAIVTAFFRRQ
jgi:hypothetical protein